jgi:hypothetical protein
MAIKRGKEILEIPIPARTDPHYARILAIVKDISVSFVNLGLKADENRLRRRENDVIDKLFAKVSAAGYPLIIEHDAPS